MLGATGGPIYIRKYPAEKTLRGTGIRILKIIESDAAAVQAVSVCLETSP